MRQRGFAPASFPNPEEGENGLGTAEVVENLDQIDPGRIDAVPAAGSNKEGFF